MLPGFSAGPASPKSHSSSIKGGGIKRFLYSYAFLLEYECPLAFYCLHYEERHINTKLLFWYLHSETETEKLYIYICQ